MDKLMKILQDIGTLREGLHIEAKSASGGLPDSLWDSYSAFANTDGGTILLGVKERKDNTLVVQGIQDIDKMEKDFWNMCHNRQKVNINLLTDRMVHRLQIEDKWILAIDVPRADRSQRPVFKGTDPRTGTYRRNGEGDYLCTIEEVSAMFRDADNVSQDSRVIEDKKISSFCMATVKRYRRLFNSTHVNHHWNSLDDEVFLRRIGALSVGQDGEYHPTFAGLLLFGYEYEIIDVFPQYFLDYQENADLLSSVRWTDRITSSSGDWSGNVVDFVLDVAPRLTAGLKKPFVLKGMTRVDDTPVHKILREALTNAIVHADFFGRRGVVIKKDAESYSFANPGCLRVSKDVAIDGGVSDPRNSVMLKVFSLINYGERAGSGLSNIFYTWEHVFHTKAELNESMGVDRVTLYLRTEGHAQDVQAMLDLYDNTSDIIIREPDYRYDAQDEGKSEKYPFDDFSTGIVSESYPEPMGIPSQSHRDSKTLKDIYSDDDDEKEFYMEQRTRQDLIVNARLSWGAATKMAKIVALANREQCISTEQAAVEIQASVSTAKRYIYKLCELGYLYSQGTHRNRVYLPVKEG